MQIIKAILLAVIIYTIQKKLYELYWYKNLKVDIKFVDRYIEAGEKSRLLEVINNAKLLPLPVIHVKYAVSRSFLFSDYENVVVTDMYHRNDTFSVMGNRKITRNLEFIASMRGLYDIQNANVVSRDLFMTSNFAERIDCNTFLYVFPKKIKELNIDIALNTILGEIETRKSLMEDPYTFRGIRDYDVSDNMSKINWKATARTSNLMVNLYNHTSEYKVKIILNVDVNTMYKTSLLREKCIELASTTAQYMLKHKIPVMLKSNGLDKITGECGEIDFGASYNHLTSIDKYLARIDKDCGVDKFMHILNEEVKELDTTVSYVIISANYNKDIILKLSYMKKYGADIHMIVPYYRDTEFVSPADYAFGWEVNMDDA